MRISILFISIVFVLSSCLEQGYEGSSTELLAEAEALKSSDPAQCIALLEPLIVQSEATDNHRVSSKAYHIASFAYYQLGEKDREYESLTKAQYHAKEVNDIEMLIKTQGDLTEFYYNKGLYKKAVEFGQEAFILHQEHGFPQAYQDYMIFCYTGALSNVDEFRKSNEVLSEFPYTGNSFRINQLEWMSFNYFKLGELEKARELAEECLALLAIDNANASKYILNTIGGIHKKQGDINTATEYFDQSADLGYYHAVFNLGDAYEKLGRNQEAIEVYERMRFRDIDHEISISVLTIVHKSLNRLQSLYYSVGKAEEARAVMQESEALLERKALTEAAQKELEAIYALDKLKEQALNDLIKEKEEQASVNRQIAILFAGLLSIVLVAFFSWAWYSNRRRYTEAHGELSSSVNEVIDFLSSHTTAVERNL